jgi:hypothetical protein
MENKTLPVNIPNTRFEIPTMISNTPKSLSIIHEEKKKVYIVDFFNIFSDFREIKYKINKIDFHMVKHNNIFNDTYEFFDLFFTKYIQHVGISKKSSFYFIMKKLNNYDTILDNVMKNNLDIYMKFVIIEDKFENPILDKNKDDFICQYFFHKLQKTHECTLISNDKYRDKNNYIRLFNFDLYIKLIKYNKSKHILEKNTVKIVLTNTVMQEMFVQKYPRRTIPKKKLSIIL